MPGTNTRRKGSMADRVYEALKDDIFEFRLIPGDKFSEGDVGTRLNASRTPVREALYRLQREGFVEVLFRSGWQVKPFDFEELEELYDLRIILERAAMHRLCQIPDTSRIVRGLTAIWNPDNPCERATGSSVRALDESFHYDLVSAAGNRELARIHREVTDRLQIIQRLDFRPNEQTEAIYREHAAILAALRNGNAEQAANLMTEHIRISQRAIREITMERIQRAAEAHQEWSKNSLKPSIKH